MKSLKEQMAKIGTFEEAWTFVKEHDNELNEMERLITHKRESVYIDVCLIGVSIYFGLLPLIQIFFSETSDLTYAILGTLWVVPLILIIIDIASSRKKRIAWDYLFLAIHDYRLNNVSSDKASELSLESNDVTYMVTIHKT